MISSSIYEWEWNKYDTPHDHILKQKLYFFPFQKVTYFINNCENWGETSEATGLVNFSVK